MSYVEAVCQLLATAGISCKSHTQEKSDTTSIFRKIAISIVPQNEHYRLPRPNIKGRLSVALEKTPLFGELTAQLNEFSLVTDTCFRTIKIAPILLRQIYIINALFRVSMLFACHNLFTVIRGANWRCMDDEWIICGNPLFPPLNVRIINHGSKTISMWISKRALFMRMCAHRFVQIPSYSSSL